MGVFNNLKFFLASYEGMHQVVVGNESRWAHVTNEDTSIDGLFARFNGDIDNVIIDTLAEMKKEDIPCQVSRIDSDMAISVLEGWFPWTEKEIIENAFNQF